MFQQRGRLPVLRIVALQALDEGDDHGPVEERVFAIDLFAASPARIARQIGLRPPQHQHLAIVFCGLRDEARLVALDAAAWRTRSGSHDSPIPGGCGNCVVVIALRS